MMPRTVHEIAGWDGKGLPGPATCVALTQDLIEARAARTVGIAARRLNLEDAGLRTTITVTARRLPDSAPPPEACSGVLVEIEPAWAQPPIWHALQRARGPMTDLHLLSALDRQRDDDGHIVSKAGGDAVYVDVLARTFAIAASTTVLCLLLALPTAQLLVSVSPSVSRLLMLALLLPLWTSVLVRSAAWLVLLQKNGLVNQALMWLGVISEPLALIYNRTGVLIALIHVLLPFAVLPISQSMRSLPPSQMRAASSLGAPPWTSFWRVYLPQIIPGMSAGGMLVFILALGYYVTPLLLGGAGDQLLPFYIAYNATQTVNWGLASALGGVLLLATLLMYALYVRLVGVHRVGLG
ncbi:MAG: ABC transporter permease [Burkholderiales bacterium]